MYCNLCEENFKNKYQHRLSSRHEFLVKLSDYLYVRDELLTKLREENKNGVYTDEEYEELEDRIIQEFYDAVDRLYEINPIGGRREWAYELIPDDE